MVDRIILNAQRGSALVKSHLGRCRFPNLDGSRCMMPTDVVFVGRQHDDGKPRTQQHICRDHAAPLVGLRSRRN